MRNLRLLDQYRQTDALTIKRFGGVGNERCGVFVIPSNIDSQNMVVLASGDFGWDHVSVSRKSRCPNWPEMCQIRRLFFKDDEVVMELHVAVTDHINCHPNCLHLWRPHNAEIPLPPDWMVGPRKNETAAQASARADAEMDKMEAGDASTAK